MPKPGDTISWWQKPFLIVSGIAQFVWAVVTGKPWNTENR